MKAAVQRVNRSCVTVDGEILGKCDLGLLVYVGVFIGDQKSDADKLADKIADLRIFEDWCGKMNHNVRDVRGDILVIPNFTLTANARKGRIPSFESAARGDEASELFEGFVSALKEQACKVETGQFGAHMTIESEANGPVNMILDTRHGHG
ncbi:MAG: D-tyrosyl-tRNA(Tyr) deacylase [bacterium]|nr:D-tyrosyl-tRNA(Tyr) deacylase [bacterium]